MSVDPQLIYPDQMDAMLHPRECLRLFGHEQASKTFLEACASGRLHHAFLLLGDKGIGKASFAYNIAKYILSGGVQRQAHSISVEPDNIDARLVTSGSHPNLLVLRRTWNEKTKKFAARISVDNVRELQRFLGNTAGRGRWRVVIVDRADDLNSNAANALLKMLEEPPAFCLFLLVSSEPGRLPVTILSRCQKLRFARLEPAVLQKAVQHVARANEIELPTGEQLDLLLKLAGGSVRQALELAHGRTLEDYRQITQMLDLLPRVDPQTVIALSGRLSVRANEGDYHSFVQLLSVQLHERIRQMVIKDKGNKLALAQWAQLWETISVTKADVDQLNLDRGNFIIDLFARIEKVAHEAGGLAG